MHTHIEDVYQKSVCVGLEGEVSVFIGFLVPNLNSRHGEALSVQLVGAWNGNTLVKLERCYSGLWTIRKAKGISTIFPQKKMIEILSKK